MLLLISGALFACKKQSGNIVLDGQGNKDQLKLLKTDTFSIIASTIKEDSNSGAALNFFTLGQMNDPVTGKSSSSIYSPLELFSPSTSFPAGAKLDSVVMILPMASGTNFFGNKTTPQQLDVFTLSESLDLNNNIYYFTAEPKINSTAIGSYQGVLYSNKNDTIRYGTSKLAMSPGIRIKLNDDFGNFLLQMPSSAFTTNADLAAQIKGIAIVPSANNLSSGEGGLGVFDFPTYTGSVGLNLRPKILLYYNDTSTFAFVLGSKTLTLNTGKTGPYTGDIATQIANSSVNYPATYAQGLGGLKTFIRIPHLFNIGEGKNIAINNAELTIKVDKSTISSDYPAPARLNIFRKNGPTTNRNVLTTDVSNDSKGVIGLYEEANGLYRFKLTDHLQELFSYYFSSSPNNYNYGLFITIPTNSPVTGSRIVLKEPKLSISYTKIN